MSKHRILLIFTVLLVLFCRVLNSKEKLYDNYSKVLNKWEKSVIVEGHINALLPYNLENKETSKIERHQFLMISLKNTLLNIDDTYLKIPVRIDETIDNTFERYNLIFKYYSSSHPTAWDISSEYNLYFNDLSQGSIFEIYNSINHYKKYINPINKSTEYMHSNSYKINYNKVFKKKFVEVVNDEGKIVFKEVPFDPLNGINNSIISKNDKTLEMFLFNQKQVLVWKVDFTKEAEKIKKVWEFQYAFKLPFTAHFEICQIGYDLYILTNKYGIYKLDIVDAKKNVPEPPKDVFKKYSDHENLIWDGFTQEHIVENNVKAKKVSDLKYDSYVVDKDHNTAYIITDGYLYEIDNLKIRSKIPKLRKTESFLDKEAERMRVVLEAIYNLGNKPEKTPGHLLIVTPDTDFAKNTDIENPEEKDTTNNYTDESEDDDETMKNGSDADKTDMDNGTDSEDSTKNTENTDNKSIANDSADSMNNKHNQAKDNAGSKPDSSNLSEDTNILMYLGISAGMLVLISLIFIIFFRKKTL